MIDKNIPIPFYYQIKSDIINEIETGKYTASRTDNG